MANCLHKPLTHTEWPPSWTMSLKSMPKEAIHATASRLAAVSVATSAGSDNPLPELRQSEN